MMPANAQVYQTTTITNATIVTDAETIVATVPSVSVDSYGSIVRVEGMINLTVGTDGDSVTFQVRRNTVTGTQVGDGAAYNVLDGGTYSLAVPIIAAQPIGLHSYVITATVGSASANSTVNAAAVTVTVGN